MRTNHRLTWLLWLLAFVAGPALAQVRFSQWVSSHPGPAVVAIIGYEIAVVIAAFLGKVYAQLETEWVHRTAKHIDASITRALSQYRRKYRKHLIEVHRDVEIGWLSIRAPFGLPLEQVFVDLSVVSRLPHKLSSNLISTDEPSTSSSDISTFELTGRESVWEFLNGRSRVVLAIVGAPGSGKTTLLKHIALALCDSNQRRKIAKAERTTIPILLYLRDQAASISANCDVELTDLVCKSLRRILHPAAGKWFDSQLRAGRCLVMLDGLDEVAIQSERRDVVKWVEAQVARYPYCSFIVTSRRNGYWEAPLKAATVLQVRTLNPDQIEHFINLWFLATELRTTGRNDSAVRERARSKAMDLLNRLSEASALRDLAANPLLLTMIANVHNYGGTLPKSRVRLYREICQVFLGRRDEQKGLAPGDMDVDKKELVLRYLAFNMMSRHRRTLLQSDAEAAIAIPLQNVKPALSASEYLELVKRDSGLIVEDDNGLIAFVHLSLQEYLTAVQIREHGSLKDLTDNVTENWWRETILMYCAQADTGPIVRACLDINSPLALALAADCVDVALELAPVWRKAVEDALSIQRVSQDKQARLIAGGAMLERKLRRLIRLENDTYLVNTPVSNAEYLFFAENAEIRGSTRTPDVLGGSPVVGNNGSDLVTGVTASNALDLASWATNFLADGWSYRLPNSDEARDPGISRVVDVSRYGFWSLSKVSVSSRGTVYVAQPRLNSEAASICISSRELVNCMLNEFDWVKIARSIRELGPDTRRDLGTYWVSSGRLVKSWPVRGTVAALLELSNLVVALSEADLRRFLTVILTSRRLTLKEAEELVGLVELLQKRSVLSRHRRSLDTEGLGEDEIVGELDNDALTLTYVTHQFRLDVYRYLLSLRPLFDRHSYGRVCDTLLAMSGNQETSLIREVSKTLRLSVDIDNVIKLARIGMRVGENDDLWHQIPTTMELADRDMFKRAAKEVVNGLTSVAEGRMLAARVPETLRRTRLCATVCLWLMRNLSYNIDRRAMSSPDDWVPSSKARAPESEYREILASLFTLGGRDSGLLPAVETILLVRE